MSPGGAVIVQAGRYSEGVILIDKPVTIRGEGMPIVDGRGEGDVFQVRNADGVEISGFEIRGSGRSYITEFAGIKVEDSVGCVIHGNTLVDNNFGIYLANTKRCRVSGNSIRGVPGNEADTGNGIHIWQGSEHEISGNLIEGSRDGIYFEFVDDSQILGNTSCGNLRYGLHFMFSHRDKYQGNEFCRNGAGVAVMYSQWIQMIGNKFKHNSGAAAYGLLLKDIRDAVIHDNIFDSNSTSVYMEGSNRGDFQGNTFSGSGWGLRILGDCEANSFTQNDFIDNSFDVSTNSMGNPNTFSENYWSQYDGYDLNYDGVGDIPFRLVSASSLVLERIDASFMLVGSPIFRMLDAIERALPQLIPERVQDERPRMIPVAGGGKQL